MPNLSNIKHFNAHAATPSAPADADARTRALDTRASWIIEAPAGSGKTGLLMQRYLKLLTTEGVTQPEEVLAITFTRKATAELRARIVGELQAAQQDDPPTASLSEFQTLTRTLARAALDRSSALNWFLLENPQRLRIRTIDSVCAEIAGTLPLLSGSGGAPHPIEDAKPLYRSAARRTMLQLGGSDPHLDEAVSTVLLHRDASLPDCEALLAHMLAQRQQWAELIPLDRAQLDDDTLGTVIRPILESSLENIVCAGLTHAAHALPTAILRDLTALARHLSIEPGYKSADSPIAFCADRHLPPEARADHLGHWVALINLLLTKEGTWRRSMAVNSLGFSIPAAAKTKLQALIAEMQSSPASDAVCEALSAVRCLPPARYPDDQWHVAKALFRLLVHALAELKLLFAERAECDFPELALSAREALRAGSAEDLATAGANLRHLLVDEMQDTSSSQYELIDLLTRSWDGYSQTLFLVGDPKQSIYLFRQARVERFLRTMREGRLGSVPLELLNLTANFRSQTHLVESFNSDFQRIFPTGSAPTPAEAVDVPFAAATPVREATIKWPIVWHTAVLGEEPFDLAPTPGTPRSNATEEAVALRQAIEPWLTKPLPEGRTKPWEIAVLARVRNHLAAIVQEFNRTDGGRTRIPYRAVKVEALDERVEVLDVLALTRALLHPADRVAWLAVLHAPWCGLGLADLLTLTGDMADATVPIPTLILANTANLTPLGRQLLNRAWPAFQASLATLGRTSLAVHVERTWRSLGGDATLAADQLANVQRFFTLLRETEQAADPVKLADLNAGLKVLYAEPFTSHDPNLPVVDLMTIHNAKGLEWDVVLVPGLERKGQTNRSDLLNWLELDGDRHAGASVVLAPIHGKGEDPTKLYKWLNRVRCDREAAERKRLYYVAATRAREELHLFAACKRSTRTGELLVPADTLLQAAWPAAEPHFAWAAEQPANSARADFDRSLAADYQADSSLNEPLALAASADAERAEPATPPHEPPLITRLPLDFNPLQRFTDAAARQLNYTPASAQPRGPAFERPEGSFTVRAFGNVVHRFLQVLAARLAAGAIADELLAELPSWSPRLTASLRAEGLSPAIIQRESSRTLQALTQALSDPEGRWLLSPQPSSASEQVITLATSARTHQVDRTFLAGPAPLTLADTHIWIVDFKTTQQGSRSDAAFEAEERAKYSAQLELYAAIRRNLPDGDKPIQLALYYPLIPRLIEWPAPQTST